MLIMIRISSCIKYMAVAIAGHKIMKKD
jgi:hypothetical protein